jgi:hypothetical protein
VRGRGHGCVSRNKFLDVPGCLRSKLTVWKEEQFTVLPFQGIEQRKKRVAEWVAKALPLAKCGVVCRLGRNGPLTRMHTSDLATTGCVSLVMLVMAQVVRDSALVIKRWLNRVEEDASGLTFQEWTPDVDTSRPPVTMLINSSELRAAGFKLKEVLQHLRQLLACTRGAGLQSLEGMGPKRFVLSVDDDTEFRSRCE